MSSLNATLSCTVAPDSVPSNAGVAGTGILLAFIITAAIALCLSTFIILSEIRSSSSPNFISRKLLSGLSDQQIVEGISIQALGLASINSMVPYHFFIIWMLSLLSTATNMASLLALVQDYKRDWVLRWLRQAAMLVNLCLTVVFGVFVLEVSLKNLPSTLPVGCVWEADRAKSTSKMANDSLSVVGTIVVIVASAIVFLLGTWYLHLRKSLWGGFLRVTSLAVLFAIAIAATIRVVLISQAFGKPSVSLSDQDEKQWSFGQLLAVVMLLLPFISALEIYRGELQVPACPAPNQEIETMPLTGSNNGGKQRYTFQAAPWSR